MHEKSLCLGLAIFAACASPTDVCGCSPVPTSAVRVVGTVRNANGSPLSGARITARGTVGTCGGASRGAWSADAVFPTDAAGRFELIVAPVAAQDTDVVCLQILARRSVSGGADSLASPQIASTVRSSPPLDSTRVDLQFP